MSEGKRITYDHDMELGAGPTAGDVLQTVRGRTWLVLESRQVKSKVSLSRWALRVASVELNAIDGDPRILPLRWYARGKK